MAALPAKKHRILLYTTCYNVLDGVTLTVRKIEQEILNAGHSVCVLTAIAGDMQNTHMHGEHPNRSVVFLDNGFPLDLMNDPNNPEAALHLTFRLSSWAKAQIADFDPTLIHITCPDLICIDLIEYARQKELPLMGTYHSHIPEMMAYYPGMGWLKHILRAAFRVQYNFFQALFVPTPSIHKYLQHTYRMDDVTNVHVWGRGVDLEIFSPKQRSDEFRTKMGFKRDHVVICWVGRLVPEKRPDIFARVIRKLHGQGLPFRALVIGAGPCEEEMKALPNTVCVGWMSGQDLAVAYASSDIFLFPSPIETFGNVALEAAASGLPLIVNQRCLGHLVQQGITGLACREEDDYGWYHSTLCLLQDEPRRKKMSLEGRKFAHQFEKGDVCRKMLENYSMVTKEFYTEYDGHHSNRDAIYRTKEDSFVAGYHTRPLTWFFMIDLLLYALLTIAPFVLHIRKTVTSFPRLVVAIEQATKMIETLVGFDSPPCDFEITHLLAKAFVHVYCFLARWESRLRRGVSYVCKHSQSGPCSNHKTN